jgi:hypothetical protein
MSDRPRSRPRSRPPLWLVEGLDIVQHRRTVLLAVALGTIAVGALLAVLAPGIVPPSPVVGAAVAFAALLLGLAAALAVDATDLRLRGPRHVGAAGGELVAVLPVDASVDEARALASAVLDAREDDSPLLLGLAASGRDARHTAAWTEALGRALVDEQVSVLNIDLASGRSTPPGLVEVVRDGVKLSEAVRFEPGAKLARIGAGDDHVGALASLATLPERLPRDLDVLLVSLPTAASRQVVDAVRSLDHVLIVAERDETSRVDLIAGLDALDAAGTRAQVALLDDPTASRLTPRRPSSATFTASEPVEDAPPADDPSTTGEHPVAEADEPPVTEADEPPVTEADEHPVTEADERLVLDGDDDARPGSVDERPDERPEERLHDRTHDRTEVIADAAGAHDPGDGPARDEPPRDRPAHDGPDHDEPVRRREVEVLLGAAEANAIALAESGPPRAPEVAEGRRPAAARVARPPAVPDTPSTVDLDAPAPDAGAGIPAADGADPTAAAAAGPPVGSATEATAEPVTAAPVEAADEAGDELPDAPTDGPASSPADGSPHGATDDGPGDGSTDRSTDESTDELPRADGDTPIREADDPQDEMLHTTARLSILIDDLEQREGPATGERP